MKVPGLPGVERLDTVWIPLADGTRLAATIWLPEGAHTEPVPAILEYLPYRRRDGTVLRDQQMHGWYAQHGLAGVREDMRGSGDSDGLLLDEYLPQEQCDAVEVIAWLAARSWCSGTVGMIGISWGGFNGLQVAARRPPALKAIVTACSADDRYADDCHFMGGASDQYLRLGVDPVCLWRATARPGRRRSALARDVAGAAGRLPLFVARWIAEQRRGDCWKQGSVSEDYGAITAAVLAGGGWADGYSNAVPRLVTNLTAPAKGIIGPWAHAYPQIARTRSGHRLLAGNPPLVGSLAEGHRSRGGPRSCLPRLAARDDPPRHHLARTARPLAWA